MTELGKTKKFIHAISELVDIIDKRARSPSPDSYTSRMLERGKVQCAKKIGEEGVELALAVAAQDKSDIAAETADLLFHVFVGLRERNVPLDLVADALTERRGTSGLTEKANRKQ